MARVLTHPIVLLSALVVFLTSFMLTGQPGEHCIWLSQVTLTTPNFAKTTVAQIGDFGNATCKFTKSQFRSSRILECELRNIHYSGFHDHTRGATCAEKVWAPLGQPKAGIRLSFPFRNQVCGAAVQTRRIHPPWQISHFHPVGLIMKPRVMKSVKAWYWLSFYGGMCSRTAPISLPGGLPNHLFTCRYGGDTVFISHVADLLGVFFWGRAHALLWNNLASYLFEPPPQEKEVAQNQAAELREIPYGCDTSNSNPHKCSRSWVLFSWFENTSANPCGGHPMVDLGGGVGKHNCS
jgi:hypothetical protein